MPAGPIGAHWAPGSWEDTAWESDSWEVLAVVPAVSDYQIHVRAEIDVIHVRAEVSVIRIRPEVEVIAA